LRSFCLFNFCVLKEIRQRATGHQLVERHSFFYGKTQPSKKTD
jgi:hypothetical protein